MTKPKRPPGGQRKAPREHYVRLCVSLPPDVAAWLRSTGNASRAITAICRQAIGKRPNQ